MLTLNQMPDRLEFGKPSHIEYRKAWQELTDDEVGMLHHLEDDRYSQFTVGVVVPGFYQVMFYPMGGQRGISETATSIKEVYQIIGGFMLDMDLSNDKSITAILDRYPQT